MFGVSSRLVKHNLLIAGLFTLVCVVSAAAHERLISPDKRFETYTVPGTPDGSGAKLFLRATGDSKPGVLLCENDRWIEAQWSPDSRFLAVIDHSDGHIADVSIYHVVPAAAPPGVTRSLRYQSPEPRTYDTKWDVVAWDSKHATATLLRSTLKDKRRFTAKLDKETKQQ